jgi:hypothetical protein
MDAADMAHTFHSMTREPAPTDSPAPKRRGSGSHHPQHPVPRQALDRLLASALASYEVGHFSRADDFARQLVTGLKGAGVLREGRTKQDGAK